MNQLESTLADRLHAAAERIPVDVVPPADIARRAAAPAPERPRRSAIVLPTLAAAALVAVAVAVGTAGSRDPDPVVSGPASASTAGEPAAPAAAEAPPIAPHVESPPAWFGEPVGASRDVLARTGRWTTTVLGRADGDSWLAPIAVSVFDGTYEPLATAEPFTLDGTPVRSVRLDGWEGWQALATVGTPTVLVSGYAPEATLLDVLRAVEVTDSPGGLSLEIGSRPDGYTQVVPPRSLGEQVTPRRVLAGAEGHVSIDDVSDLVDPRLAAGFGGADLDPVDVAGATGWTGTTVSPSGPLRFLIWSPAPGVVFELSTDDLAITEADLVDLAERATPLSVDEWDRTYDD